jgi:hypothetical protein
MPRSSVLLAAALAWAAGSPAAAESAGERLGGGYRAEHIDSEYRALGEDPSSFTAVPDGGAVYRFFVSPDAGHPWVFVVTLAQAGTADLVVRRASGTGGYNPGTVDWTGARALAALETEAITVPIEASGFWTMTPEQARAFMGGTDDLVCLDGTSLVVDAMRGDMRQTLHRHQCVAPELTKAAQAMFAATAPLNPPSGFPEFSAEEE